MKLSLFILLLHWVPLGLPQTYAGTIRGKISAQVDSDHGGGGKSGSYSSRKFKFLEEVDYTNFKDFVVSVADVEADSARSERPKAVIQQLNGTFVPRVLAIVGGTRVEWPNRDSIFHNVFSISEARPFDLGYYKSKDEAKVVVFEEPGRVDVFCSIHARMNCIVLVMPNPWFSMADKKGHYEIENVPAGTYRIKAWHERLPAKYMDVEVPEEGIVELDITMGLADLPKI